MSKQPTRNSISNTNKRNREINETAPVQSFGFVSVGLHHDRYGKFVGIRREIQIKIELERKSRNAPVTEMRFDRAALCILSTSTMLCGVGNYSTANRMRHPLKRNSLPILSALVIFFLFFWPSTSLDQFIIATAAAFLPEEEKINLNFCEKIRAIVFSFHWVAH